ncbi:Uncharacterized protein OS=Candidatus Nitrospira defluvii GN=NIDE3429 PE=4 SV=1: TylF [Gemmata massiliana]|uniref:Methyltransferase n=2 Tax=Gemmata massiliana TaxID=1210884 RepID=A0A6P2CWX7_9BACT|nr:Uncharacterized protein OS=Candidatus Nitrospira defluvii GN=NIDE3429 PE=4 SV=1: TylF [Gemmata massiliana]
MRAFEEPHFARANAEGVKYLRSLGLPEPEIEWRTHILCWAARHALRLEGDFVECGVGYGFSSLVLCHYLDFNSTHRRFFLFDTFAGIPEAQMSATERTERLSDNRQMYPECFSTVVNTFEPFPKVQLVRGCVPQTLSQVEISKVSYLHIDMNIAAPELAAIEYFWPKLTPGAVVVFDDYGWEKYAEQQQILDAFARREGVMIATLASGQGLLIKS